MNWYVRLHMKLIEMSWHLTYKLVKNTDVGKAMRVVMVGKDGE